MKRKRKGWLLIVTLLVVVTMLLSGCSESVPVEGEQNVQESNTQAVQEKAKLPRFIAVEKGMLGDATYTLFVETTTRVVWIKLREYHAKGYGGGLGLVFEPMVDSEGNTLIYTGELTAK